MREIDRNIEEVRRLRGDLSTWLVHLTRDNFLNNSSVSASTFVPAKGCLESILSNNVLRGMSPVGQFNYKKWYKTVGVADLRAVSLTEAPVEEIFLFINIKYKALKFSSYGLVFDRDRLSKAPIYAAPVLYFSQPDGDAHFLNVFSQLEQKHFSDFKDILYLFDKFGKTFAAKDYDYRWEREWRVKGNIANVREYVKFGLCPEADIHYFEQKFSPLVFVDPFFNPRQIEEKLRLAGVVQ